MNNFLDQSNKYFFEYATEKLDLIFLQTIPVILLSTCLLLIVLLKQKNMTNLKLFLIMFSSNAVVEILAIMFFLSIQYDKYNQEILLYEYKQISILEEEYIPKMKEEHQKELLQLLKNIKRENKIKEGDYDFFIKQFNILDKEETKDKIFK